MAISTIGGAGTSAGLQPYEQVFVSSGTWTKPTGVKSVEVLVAGGGAGAAGAGASGGAGGFYRGVFDVSNLATVAVTIGAGSASGSGDGGTSSFGSLVACAGGKTNSGTYRGGDSGAWYLPSQPGSGFIDTNTTLQNTSGFPGSSLYSAGGNGALVSNGTLAVSIVSDGYVRTSTDGINWVQGDYLGTAFGQQNNKVAYGNGQWIAVGSTTYYASTNGTTGWTSRTVPNGWSANTISFANGLWFLTGSSYNQLATSTDGINWTNRALNGVVQGGRVAYGNGYYVIMPTTNANNYIMYSTDGFTWTAGQSSALTANPTTASEIVFDGGYFYAVTGNTTSVHRFASPIGSLPSINTSINTNTFVMTSGMFAITTSAGVGTYYWANGTNYQMQASYYQRALAHAGKIFFYNIQSGSPQYMLLSGYVGSGRNSGAADGNSAWNRTAGGAGGPGNAMPSTYGNAAAGPGIEGYCVGGTTQYQSFTFGSGGTTSGIQGIVRVRWWA